MGLRSFPPRLPSKSIYPGSDGDGLLQPGVFARQIFEPFRLIELETAIFPALAIVGVVRDVPFPANLLDRLSLPQQDFRFAEFVNDLFNRVFHTWHSALL